MEGYAEEQAYDMSLQVRAGVSHGEKWWTNHPGKRNTRAKTEM